MHISRSMFIFWGSTGISFHDLQFKKLLIYLIPALYAAPQFNLCLKQAVFRLCCDWPASRNCVTADFWLLRRLRQQTMKQNIVVGFHYFFSFFTPNVNFSNTSVHVIRSEIWESTTPNNTFNNLSNQGYETDDCLSTCTTRWHHIVEKNVTNEAFRAGWSPVFGLSGSISTYVNLKF